MSAPLPDLLSTVFTVTATVVICAVVFVLTRGRRTPPLKLDPNALPPVDEALSTLAGVTESTVHEGNSAKVLQNGALFDAMLEDIQQARYTVHLESFVWSAGTLEKKFVDALTARAREGVTVRVLIDTLGGSKASRHELERLKANGVQLALYCRPHWYNLGRFNHRTHRKLLVVDGSIGYTFGHGIADQWLGDAHDSKHWRDTALRLEGPVVHALQSVFAQHWIEETDSIPAGPGCFPQLRPCGNVSAHVVSSASGDATSSVATLYTVAIATARREVLIQNPYFAPDDGIVDLFAMMVRRGVRVHLMVPGEQTDSPFVRRAGCHLYGPLLRAGVRLYEFLPTLLHQKVVVVDELWSHVGSTNFDSRSLALNEEIGVGVLDRQIAMELKAAFLNDLRHCRELTLSDWERRPPYTRVFDRLAYLVHDQL